MALVSEFVRFFKKAELDDPVHRVADAAHADCGRRLFLRTG